MSVLIVGNSEVLMAQPNTYVVPGGSSAWTYSWTIEHGQIVSGQGTDTVVVTFDDPGEWRLVVQITRPDQTADEGEKIIVVDHNDTGG